MVKGCRTVESWYPTNRKHDVLAIAAEGTAHSRRRLRAMIRLRKRFPDTYNCVMKRWTVYLPDEPKPSHAVQRPDVIERGTRS